MQYQLLTLDIDGTLRPNELPAVPRENVNAVRAPAKSRGAGGHCHRPLPGWHLQAADRRHPPRLLDLRRRRPRCWTARTIRSTPGG